MQLRKKKLTKRQDFFTTSNFSTSTVLKQVLPLNKRRTWGVKNVTSAMVLIRVNTVVVQYILLNQERHALYFNNVLH